MTAACLVLCAAAVVCLCQQIMDHRFAGKGGDIKIKNQYFDYVFGFL